MNEAHVKAVIVDEVAKYFKIRFAEVYDDFLEKASVNAEIIHYDNNLGEIEAIVLTTISSDAYVLVKNPLARVIISYGKMFIEEYCATASEFIYLEMGVL